MSPPKCVLGEACPSTGSGWSGKRHCFGLSTLPEGREGNRTRGIVRLPGAWAGFPALCSTPTLSFSAAPTVA